MMSRILIHGIRNSVLALALGTSLVAAAAANEPSPAPATASATAFTDIEPLLARSDLAAYRGWLKFLKFEAVTARERDGATSAAAKEKADRLADWAKKIAADPQLLSKLTGVQEWAYESPADDSGQPFKVAIPSDYDAKRPAAMSVYMHGWSGNHLEHSAGLASAPGVFQVAVLGRGRGGGYRCLSEADVLHVVDYIQAHWAVDADRIHINGGSMGGGGTFRLGSRYPHRWASGRPTCGYASYIPVANLLTFPIYATHSADDPVVSALHARGPLARLRDLGGQAIYDETNGLGHAAWDYAEGNRRGDAWAKLRVRPPSQSVRRIDYTALDGGAARGWWAEVVEWGPAAKPARFALNAAAANTLFAELDNVTRLRLRLDEAPFTRGEPLQVVVNGAVPISLPAPLPNAIVLARTDAGWGFETSSPKTPYRLHTPGSAQLLYQGDPLLIVYGTRGSDAERAAMQAAALAASNSPNPGWVPDGGEKGPDGVPHLHNLYGRLKTKADTDVTADDIARCHLVLIGTAEQNSVVAKLADRLPVRYNDGKIVCGDGVTIDAKDRAWGLVHFNPLAPERLIFWIGSAQATTYAPGSMLPAVMGGGFALAANPCGADFVVMHATLPQLVTSRSFDSHWRWAKPQADRLLPERLAKAGDLMAAIGRAVVRYAGTDFALLTPSLPADTVAIAGTTRVADTVPLFYHAPIGLLEINGTDLVEIAKLFGPSSPAPFLIGPAIDPKTIVPERIYRIALSPDAPGLVANMLKRAPGTYRMTDLFMSDAIERYLGVE